MSLCIAADVFGKAFLQVSLASVWFEMRFAEESDEFFLCSLDIIALSLFK